MKGTELKFLAEVADLARLDFDAASITLVTHGDKLVSRYKGAYSSGQRWLEMPGIPEMNVAVSAMQFKSLAGLFSDEEDITLTLKPRMIRLQSPVKGIDMSIRSDVEEIEPFEPVEGAPYLESEVRTILDEVECATEFSARSMAKPILTGLRIAGGGGQLGIQSSDGVSSLFETRILVSGDHRMDMITPGYDLVLGLRLLGSSSIKILTTQEEPGAKIGQVILYGTNGMFRSSLLNGDWPDFSRVKQAYPRQVAKIPTSLVRSLVQSVRILGASNDLRLRGDGENLYLETIEDESGAFQAKIPGEINGTYTFDVGSFLLAQNLGSELEVQLPTEGRVPTLIESGERKFWIGSKWS